MQVGVEGKISYAGLAQEQKTEAGLSKSVNCLLKESAYPSLFSMPPEPMINPVACPGLEIPLLLRKTQKLKEQSRPFEVYKTDSNNQLIPAVDISIPDASVISYNSKGPVQALNCKAKNRTDGSLIECRHLAYAFATGCFGSKTNVHQGDPKEPGRKFRAVASIDNIQNNTAIKTDQQLTKTPTRMGITKVAVYFDEKHFGQALYEVWMNKGDQVSHGKPSQSWLLATEDHCMAIKLFPTNGSAIKIEFYDPNRTTIVRRVIVSNKEILQQLTLNQFISTHDQKCYIDHGQAGVLMSTDAVDVANDSDTTVLAALTPSLLHLLMSRGHLNNSSTDSLKTTLSEIGRDNPREFIELLTAKSKNGTPGLNMALQNGRPEAISAYFEAIKQHRYIIEPKVLKELLVAEREDGTPGLFMALQFGSPEAISTYFEGIKQFEDILEPGDLKKLLAAENFFGTPALFVALFLGRPEVISAYLGGIKLLRGIIGPEPLKELLVAKMENGTTGLSAALQNGSQEVVRAYVQGVNKFLDIIRPEAINELLAPLGGCPRIAPVARTTEN